MRRAQSISTSRLRGSGVFLSVARRWQTRVPNKGYREQVAVPDRLKGIMAMAGCDAQNVSMNDENIYLPEGERQRGLQSLMTHTQNLRSVTKLDRLRTALDKVRNKEIAVAEWQEVYLFLRTTEMCCEVAKDPSDTFPDGKKLWIEMQSCEEKRVPHFLELPNGMMVLPIFSMEEYLDGYFLKTSVFESCWFPIPRAGSQWKEFCKLPFPVCVTGGIEHFAMLATVAMGAAHQFGILLNPGQKSSKFLTYPELVTLTQQKRIKSRDRNLELKQTSADGEKEEFLFDENLMSTFDTSKVELKRVETHEVADKMKNRPRIPPVAQLELQLLLYRYPEIVGVYIRTMERPKWRTMLGASNLFTQIDVVCGSGGKPDPAFFSHLQRWSFMKEFNSDVHVELTDSVPTSTPGQAFLCVYTEEDGKMLRSWNTYRGGTLVDKIGYDKPLVDKDGNKPYEKYESFF